MDSDVRRGKPDAVRIRKVIEVVTIKGKGIDGDPVRRFIQYWSLDGKLLAEHDTYEHESM